MKEEKNQEERRVKLEEEKESLKEAVEHIND